MSRNKYPEETIQKIIEIAFRLFREKGYDETSIQDIVDELGMSKGAIYYHFKSKEDILDKICHQYYDDMNWYEDIVRDTTLNGLQKLQKLFLFELTDKTKREIDIISLPMLDNPRIVTSELESAIELVAPLLEKLIRQGVQDGSLQVKSPKDAAEVMILLINFWINPGLFPADRERFMQKVRFYKEVTDGIGLPLIEDSFFSVCEDYYNAVYAERNDRLAGQNRG
ncbi:TetR/AcrR family transcriptional regulator [Candidatus Soleaferrea massiliensis]|uniref:TetR/AcrR family transcriptional regulator n=1 Tax=Candidatus Soleaferrea massiliensis TaxID=1470354 RepID=UPI00058C4D6E|nr:TetR/AcrR family transcriptional regulator [Candidatus Soleaferrea massiliensis]